MAFTINNTQEQPLSFLAFNAAGVQMSTSGLTPTWGSSNTALIQVGTAPDGQQVAAAVHGAVGTALITVQVSRDDGSFASASETVNVVAVPVAEPASVSVSLVGSARPRSLV